MFKKFHHYLKIFNLASGGIIYSQLHQSYVSGDLGVWLVPRRSRVPVGPNAVQGSWRPGVRALVSRGSGIPGNPEVSRQAVSRFRGSGNSGVQEDADRGHELNFSLFLVHCRCLAISLLRMSMIFGGQF
ncbi:hypothetical protein Dimus_017172 [Dionaea muscipula]